MSYIGETPIGLRDCGLGGCSVGHGLRRLSPPSPPEKALPREGGGSSHSPHSTAELLGLGNCDPAPHRAALVLLCSSRREQRFLRQLPDLFSSCLPRGQAGIHPDGAACRCLGLHALLWGCVPCSGGSNIAPGAPDTAPRALHCFGALHSAPGAPNTVPRALCIAPELCTPLPGLRALLWSSVLCSQGLCTFSSCSFSQELLVLPKLLPSPVQLLAARSSCCFTATSQPPSASRPLTACVPGHTSISQGPAGPAPMAFCSCSPWGTLVTRVGDSGQVLPTLSSGWGRAVALPDTEELGPALPRAISCCT